MEKLLTYIRHRLPLCGGAFRPIIITDIDGVLLRGSTPVAGTLEAIKQLNKCKIPIACLTNGGGQLQSLKINKMNEIFKEQLFTADLMFMNHSPVRPHLLKHSKQTGILLITGSLHITDILDDLNIYNYVTAEELFAIFNSEQQSQSSQYLSFFERNISRKCVIEKVQKRLKLPTLPSNYHKWGQIINSIFALNDVSPYEVALEVIHNVFTQKKKRGLAFPPYYASQNDIVWAGGYHRPRLAFGPFNYMLEEHCQRHQFQLNKFYFGKPQKLAFEFVENYMIQRFGNGCFFMVGDNPRADIKGANCIEWGSFLTQTGVHQGSANDQDNPATMVVNNFKQAMDLILQIKRQNLYL